MKVSREQYKLIEEYFNKKWPVFKEAATGFKAKASPGADIKVKMSPNLINAASGKFYRGIAYEMLGETPWKKSQMCG